MCKERVRQLIFADTEICEHTSSIFKRFNKTAQLTEKMGRLCETILWNLIISRSLYTFAGG